MPVRGATGAARLDDLHVGPVAGAVSSTGPEAGPGVRWGVDRRGDPEALARAVARARPVSLVREHRLPVLTALEGLLPDAGLVRGTTVAVTGTSLALALAAGPSRAGSWVALVGVPWLGLAAVAGLGLALERVAVVAEPEPAVWATVAAALVGAFDVVVVAEPERVRAADARRLAARARERGTVLVAVRPSATAAGVRAGGRGDRGDRHGLEADLRLALTTVGWEGLGDGHGHLRARRVRVEATGRRRAARPRVVDLWLPGPDGSVLVAADPVVRRGEGSGPGLDGSVQVVADPVVRRGEGGRSAPTVAALRVVEPPGRRRAG